MNNSCPSPTRLASAALTFLLALLAPLGAQEPRLANVSTLANVGTGADVLTAGFVIGGTASKQVVIRGVGPRLATAPFNVPGTLADPELRVFGPNSSTVIAAQNDNWASTNAATMTAVGAFALTPNSRDAVVVATLPPGAYSAQVSGVGGATGLAIVEVYEVGGAGGHFLNLSTRAQVSANAGALTPGFVITTGGGTRKMLVRAAGPALTQLGVPGALANPTLALLRNGGTFATNDDWSTPVGNNAVGADILRGAFTQAGAFAFPASSRDSALLLDLAPGSYTVQVSGVGNTSGIAVVEVYDLTPAELPTITVAVTKAQADETGAKNGEFVFTRTGPIFQPLTVRYGMGGTAVNGFDYLVLPGTITFPAGESSVTLALKPNPDLQSEGTDTAVLTLATDPGYIIGAQSSATVTIADAPATLYIASVRPLTNAVNSTGSGTATILLSADGSLAAINLSVSNLSSEVTSVHLQIQPSGDFVFNLPYSASGSAQWTFTPTGNYTSSALLAALKSGNIFVGIDTAKYPQGEVRGTFVLGAGSQNFVRPGAVPAASLENVSATDAARFLLQATFGPTVAEIEALAGRSIDAWITAQLALPFTSHRAAILADRTTYGGSGSFTNWNAIHPPNRQAAWWKNVLTSPDQLRQRVAFALSQIFVVSDVALGDDNRAEPLANYYDLLGNGAFGNFRTLLENVTLSPIMGEYLSHLRNAKATYDNAGNVLTTPDENYAREVMQLFTIGLVQLHPDGTLILGPDGLPIPTYNQNTITEMAKVFTGWAYPSTNPNDFRSARANFIAPMQLYPAFHDDTAKDLRPVSSTPIPSARGGATDLSLALNALYDHPNTAPFISKLLIQRLVTSNPSAGYVHRVAQIFEREKASATQLGTVVRAILTDYEARSPEIAANVGFGKLKEPLLRLTALLRGFAASSISGRYLGFQHTVDGVPITSATPKPATANQINPLPNTFSSTRLDGVQNSIAQAALRSPTVFNFFHPDYVLPGPLASAGLVVPEFEITDDNFAINVPNFLRNFVIATVPNNPTGPYTITLNTSAEQALVANPTALIDRLNLLLCANSMPAATRDRITTALARLSANTSAPDRVNTAILLVLTSPAAAVQK